MKLSDILNICSAVLTFLFIIFLIGRSIKSGCFSWIEYTISFVTLFLNLGINLLGAIGR